MLDKTNLKPLPLALHDISLNYIHIEKKKKVWKKNKNKPFL